MGLPLPLLEYRADAGSVCRICLVSKNNKDTVRSDVNAGRFMLSSRITSNPRPFPEYIQIGEAAGVAFSDSKRRFKVKNRKIMQSTSKSITPQWTPLEDVQRKIGTRELAETPTSKPPVLNALV